MKRVSEKEKDCGDFGRCDRCGRALAEKDIAQETACIHVTTFGETSVPFELGNGEVLPAGSFYHGDSFYEFCPDCSVEWRQWFALFMGEGEAIAMYGRDNLRGNEERKKPRSQEREEERMRGEGEPWKCMAKTAAR